MGASRESFNIWWDIKYKNWERVKQLLPELFKFWKKSWQREYIIKDSIKTPFNKKIGCKLFGHKWSTEKEIKDYDLDGYHCWKCNKWETFETHTTNQRNEKLEKLLK
jgi:hypothetical protein